jgi:hypothetical protein
MRLRLIVLLLAAATSAHAAIDPVAARGAFGELRTMCDRDAGKMWGVPLCGPTLFVERDTRAVAADTSSGSLRASDRVFIGTLPKEIGIANTAVDWDGTHWTMVLWPLPADAYARRVILGHESWHRVQEGLGFPLTAPSNAHLDTSGGRTLMQLEWRALAAALRSRGSARKKALGDALHFREVRRATFASAAKDERELEMHEGLAEYSGTKLAEPSVAARVPHLLQALHDAEATPTFVRSFAYASGPAYGAMLEAADPHWTRKLKSDDDFGVLIAQRYHVKASKSVTSNAYDAVALRAAEEKREAEQQARLQAFQARFVDGQTIVLPLARMNMQFDPNETQSYPGHGTVYPKIHLTDEWGAINVKRGGALISSDWTKMIVPKPPSDDYTLTLADGWEVREGTVRCR